MSTEHDVTVHDGTVHDGTVHDGTGRDPIEQRLRAAGARWRAAHGTGASAGIPSLSDGAEHPPAGPDTVEIPLVPSAQLAQHRRRGPWIAAGLAGAATVVAVLLAVVITRPGADDGGQPGSARSAEVAGLAGIDWTLVEARDVAGTPVPVSGDPQLRFNGNEINGSDGCNHISGTVGIHDGELGIEHLGTTMMACVDRPAGFEEMVGLIHAVLGGEVRYSLAENALTLTAAGAGTLVYSGTPRPTRVTDPRALPGTHWRLESISSGNGPDATASTSQEYAKVTLDFDQNGHLAGNDGCNGFGADITIGSGTASISRVLGTMMACPDAPDQQVRRILTGNVQWSIAADRLTISKSGVGALAYVKSD